MLTKAQIDKSTKIAVKNMQDTIKTMDGATLLKWKRFWQFHKAHMFTPNLSGVDKEEFIKRKRGRPRKNEDKNTNS